MVCLETCQSVKFEEHEPHLKLVILKSSEELSNIQTQYILTPRGMVGSLRPYNAQYITIGRQQITDDVIIIYL